MRSKKEVFEIFIKIDNIQVLNFMKNNYTSIFMPKIYFKAYIYVITPVAK
jgi:hypothetical protein